MRRRSSYRPPVPRHIPEWQVVVALTMIAVGLAGGSVLYTYALGLR